VLLGGQHTSNVTGTWLMMHLLNSPEWREKVMAEQREIMGEDCVGDFATYDQVAKMTVLHQCLQETLRLHPPFFQLARRVTTDVEYKGTIIPEGRLVCISPGAVMRVESLFKNPHEFDPNRFSEEKLKNMEAHSFLPFGGGRHICTGKKFALTSIKTVVSWLFRNFDFENAEIPLPDYTTMVVAPSHSKDQCAVKYTRKH
jgi:sterol 14-demethylase